ncbi:MAG TPA: FUSC family membrane protein, partial [Bacteroidales bacterium]|nr:FUSC family membrane protein [Bacteroidales bacterium]
MGKKRRQISDVVWVRYLVNAFWRYPDRLLAIKATLAMALVSVPLILAGKPFFGLTLALGALAGALAETDDHPRGRIKALLLTVLSFTISTLSVQLLLPYPWIFGVGFAGSTIVFILLGGMGERYRGITFGAILIGIYAMLGAPISPTWYWQPVLLPAGALFYGVVSLILLYYKPWRLLEEQLARGFIELSHYLEEKAKLFPSDVSTQAEIRNRLALLNINVVGALEKCKDVLNSYGQEVKRQEVLRPYLQRFMLLQGLHERAASSHEQYDVLSDGAANREMLEGLGELLRQLSYAARLVAENMLTGAP